MFRPLRTPDLAWLRGWGLPQVILRLGFSLLLFGLAILLSGCAAAGQAQATDGQAGAAAAGAAAKTGAQDTIQDNGSDTLVNLALAWAEKYMGEHPDVRISVTGGGSGTGIAALINGTVDIANASREMTAEEIAAAKKNGIEPVELHRGPRCHRRGGQPDEPGRQADTCSRFRTSTPARSPTGSRSAARTGRSCCSRANRIRAPTCTFWRTSSVWARRATCCSRRTRC